MKRPLTLGYSPCPNDTFIFYAFSHGLVELPGFRVSERLEDVETLNQLALDGLLDLTKISYHALGHLRERYALLHGRRVPAAASRPHPAPGRRNRVPQAWPPQSPQNPK